MVLLPLPVRRERVGVRGDGAAELERRAPPAIEYTLILAFSRRTGRRDKS